MLYTFSHQSQGHHINSSLYLLLIPTLILLSTSRSYGSLPSDCPLLDLGFVQSGVSALIILLRGSSLYLQNLYPQCVLPIPALRTCGFWATPWVPVNPYWYFIIFPFQHGLFCFLIFVFCFWLCFVYYIVLYLWYNIVAT